MSKQAVLLVNLGSPDSPSVRDVRRYLREFLMDGRVIDAPWLIRFGVVYLSILPRRPHASSEAYHSIWTAEGSPLIVLSRRLQSALQAKVEVPVELAMRYQNPSIDSAISRLVKLGVQEVLLIPLFPHYAMSSYETAVERVKASMAHLAPSMRLQIVPPYFDRPDYIEALAASAAPYLQEPFDHLLFSFHGLPQRHLIKSDREGGHCLKVENCCDIAGPAHATCYRAQCFKTARAFLAATGIASGRVSISFQSRLGRDPWMLPYTDSEIKRLAQSGVRKLHVISPAFVSDCLETLEELGIQGRDAFLRAGGEQFMLIPCLNDHPQWIDALHHMVEEFLAAPLSGAPFHHTVNR